MKEEMVIGTNINLEHQKCEYSYSNGYKQGAKTGYIGDGYYSQNNGFGWGSTMRPSKLILNVQVNDRHEEVWIDKFFKEHWGRLTANRVAAIKATMPQFVLLQKQVSVRGTEYYTLAELYAKAWLYNAKLYMHSGENKAAEVDKAIVVAYDKRAAHVEV